AQSLAFTVSSVTIAEVDTGISTRYVHIKHRHVHVTATGFVLDNGKVIDETLENSVEFGDVTLISTEGTAVFANNLTITGGTVTIEGHRYYGIMSMGPIVISGTPTVTVFGEMGGIWDITSSLIAVNGVSYVSEQ